MEPECLPGLPEEFKVTRYHSLIVRGESLPEEYQVDAVSKDGAVMGISHKILPLYGYSFIRKQFLRNTVMSCLRISAKSRKDFSRSRKGQL